MAEFISVCRLSVMPDAPFESVLVRVSSIHVVETVASEKAVKMMLPDNFRLTDAPPTMLKVGVAMGSYMQWMYLNHSLDEFIEAININCTCAEVQ